MASSNQCNSVVEESELYKVVIVGDGLVGKTSMLMSFAHNEFPTGYVPTILETYAKLVSVDNKQATLQLWDTAGQESFDHLRGLAYSNTHIFLLSFDITNKNSFDNAELRWYKELQNASPGVPILLVGTHLDLRDEEKSTHVSFTEGIKLAQRLNLKNYLECSALTRKGLDDIFVEATRICRRAKNQRKPSLLVRITNRMSRIPSSAGTTEEPMKKGPRLNKAKKSCIIS